MNRSFLGFAMSLPYAWERGKSLQKLEKICSSDWMKRMGWKYVPVVWFFDTLSKRRERREHACERERWRSSERETRICDCGCGGKELDSDDFHVISARLTQFFGYSKTHTHTQTVKHPLDQQCLLRSWWIWMSLKLWPRPSCRKWLLTILPPVQKISIVWERIGMHSLASGNNLLASATTTTSWLVCYKMVFLSRVLWFPHTLLLKDDQSCSSCCCCWRNVVAVPLQFQCWILTFSHLQFGAYIFD